MKGLSIRRRLGLSFLGVALVAALSCSGVYTYFLIRSFQESLSERAGNARKSGLSQVSTFLRQLQTYSDLISSDTNFGQVLSFDSIEGISAKMKEYKALSKADLVLFVPRPAQYVSIKYHVFSNKPSRGLHSDISAWATKVGLLKKIPKQEELGWAMWNKQVYVFAAKPVLHFGANMGAIVVADLVDAKWTQRLKESVGAEFLVFNQNPLSSQQKLVASSFSLSESSQSAVLSELNVNHTSNSVQLILEGNKYISVFQKQAVYRAETIFLGFLVSIGELEKAQQETLKKVLFLALGIALFAALIGYFIARAISNPLQNMTTVIQSIALTNDLSKRVSGKYKAEIGILAGSFNQLVERLQVTTDKLSASEKRMKDELTVASTVQDMLFPERDYAVKNIQIASFLQSSTETGGDWFDYFTTEDHSKTFILIGDVTGHGVPAALITAIMTGFAQALKRSTDLPSCDKILENINSALMDSAKGKLHMTFFVAMFDHGTSELRYSNGGHNRPFVCQVKPDQTYSVATLASNPSQRLGESANVKFEEDKIVLNSGDVVAFYTDGLLECSNAKLDSFGKRRVTQVLKANAANSASDIRSKIIKDAFVHYDGFALADDVTLVTLKAS